MKVLTVRQPWASLIVAGIKTIETRPAPPNGPMRPAGVRGLPGLPIEPGERIGIHAAARAARLSEAEEAWQAAPCSFDGMVATIWPERDEGAPDPLPLGALVGTVEVVEVLPIVDAERGWTHDADTPDGPFVVAGPGFRDLTEVRWTGFPVQEWDEADISDQLPLGNWQHGGWAWLLANPERCDPQPMRGRQGVWATDQIGAAS